MPVSGSVSVSVCLPLSACLCLSHNFSSPPPLSLVYTDVLRSRYFKGWALKSWAWIDSGGGRQLRRDGSGGLFLDGLCAAQCNASSGNEGGCNVTWSYNQGVVLSGLGKLYTLTGDEALLTSAEALVNDVLRHLTVPANRTVQSDAIDPALARVLIEPSCGGAGCDEGSDHAMFKGALMRHLGYLRRTVGLPKEQRLRYLQFALSNADSCWWHARESTTRYRRVGPPVSDELFGNDWRGPWAQALDGDKNPVATSQIAALSLFSSLLPDGGGAADGGKRKAGTIAGKIESAWNGSSSGVKAAAAAAALVALLLLLGSVLLAPSRRRPAELRPAAASVYTDIAVHAQARPTGSEWARGQSREASETQPLLGKPYGSL